MKIIVKTVCVVIAFIALSACKEKKQEGGDGQKAGIAVSQPETHGADASTTIASLTQEQMKAVGIKLGIIENKNLTAAIKANGILRVPNNNRANATSLYGGVVKTLQVELGDDVRKGQVIATIENPQFIQLQEEYLTMGSRVTLAEQEMQRQQELHEGSAGALKNLQNAAAEFNTLRTRKASLQQQIRMMGIDPNAVSNGNLKHALAVLSPISGTISNVFAKLGSYVDVSSPVVEIVDNESLHLDLQVFERDLPLIKVGQVVNFTLTNNPQMSSTAKVFSISSSFENESKTVIIHCAVTGNKIGLIDGMNITAMTDVAQVEAAAVLNEAIVEADGKYYIFIRTDKQSEAGHAAGGNEQQKEHLAPINFEKIEVMKGVSELGYTAITPLRELPKNTEVVMKGAFFINAKMSGSGGHAH